MKKKYKVSKYNIYHANYAFNTRQVSLIKIDEDLISLLKSGEVQRIEEPLVQELEALGFTLPDDVNELELFKFKYKNMKYDKRILDITFIPGYKCNSACKYCYASSVIMNFGEKREEEGYVDNFVKWCELLITHLKPSRLNFAFHGGEPTLYVEKVFYVTEKIREICDRRGIESSIGIVTNGTLLDDTSKKKLLGTGLTNFLITIDGTEEIHNFRRPLKGNRPSFEKTLENVKLLLKSKANVYLSQNVDSQNKENVLKLLDFIHQIGLNEFENFYFLVTAVKPGPDYQSLPYFKQVKPLQLAEYAEVKLTAYKRAMEFGFNIGDPLGAGICSLKQLNTYIVDIYGDIYKCVTLVGCDEAKVGTIYEPIENIFQRNLYFDLMEPWIYNEACSECVYLPLCHGGCMQQAKIEFPEFPMGTKVNCLKEYLDALFPAIFEILHKYYAGEVRESLLKI